MSTSGWRQGVRKRDSLSEENKGDPTPGCFSEGLPTPPKAVPAVGWKLVSDADVKAQLALELVLSCSFCFPSRPCGDTAGSSLRSKHLCHSSSSTRRCLLPLFLSPGAAPWPSLFFPSRSQSIRAQCRGEAGTCSGQQPPAPLWLPWWGRCLIPGKALQSAEQRGQESTAQLEPGRAAALAAVGSASRCQRCLQCCKSVLCRQLLLGEL